MPEVRVYREKLYASYASIQIPGWTESPGKAVQINRRAILHRLRGWLPQSQDSTCLDLGCGSGDLILALRSVGFHDVIGVDLGPEQVAIARSRGVPVVQANILEYLRESDQTFDLIFAFDVVEHFTKDEVLDLFALIWKHLKPGGRVILQTPNALSPWGSHLRYNDLTHELIFGPGCLASTLRMSAFKDVEFRELSPYIHGFVSAIRWILWQFVRVGYAAVNYIESGWSYGGVYTTNMLASALKE